MRCPTTPGFDRMPVGLNTCLSPGLGVTLTRCFKFEVAGTGMATTQ
jgi:hypothetical protein